MNRRLSEIWYIFLEELIRSLKSGKLIIFSILYAILLYIGIIIANKVQPFIILAGTLGRALPIASDLPFAITLTHLISALVLPFLAVLISYDAIAGERKDRTIKHLVIKTSRSSSIFGKFIADWLIVIILIGIFTAGAYLHTYLTLDFFSTDIFIKSFIFLSAYSSAFIAAGILFSSFSKEPLFALLWSILFILVSFVLNSFNQSIGQFTVFHYGFMTPSDMVSISYNVIIILIYTSLLLNLGVQIFKRCDL